MIASWPRGIGEFLQSPAGQIDIVTMEKAFKIIRLLPIKEEEDGFSFLGARVWVSVT